VIKIDALQDDLAGDVKRLTNFDHRVSPARRELPGSV